MAYLGSYPRPVCTAGRLRHPAMVCGCWLVGALLVVASAGRACAPCIYQLAVELDGERPFLPDTGVVITRQLRLDVRAAAPVRLAINKWRPVRVRPVERAAAEENDVIAGSLASLIDEAP